MRDINKYQTITYRAQKYRDSGISRYFLVDVTVGLLAYVLSTLRAYRCMCHLIIAGRVLYLSANSALPRYCLVAAAGNIRVVSPDEANWQWLKCDGTQVPPPLYISGRSPTSNVLNTQETIRGSLRNAYN